MPFRKYSNAYSPEVLEAMTAAYETAIKSSLAPTEAEKVAMKDRILANAAKGVVDEAELTRVALQTRH